VRRPANRTAPFFRVKACRRATACAYLRGRSTMKLAKMAVPLIDRPPLRSAGQADDGPVSGYVVMPPRPVTPVAGESRVAERRDSLLVRFWNHRTCSRRKMGWQCRDRRCLGPRDH
jgi:hypothetical protein